MKTEQEIRDQIQKFEKNILSIEEILDDYRKRLVDCSGCISNYIEKLRSWTRTRDAHRLIIQQLEWVLGQ